MPAGAKKAGHPLQFSQEETEAQKNQAALAQSKREVGTSPHCLAHGAALCPLRGSGGSAHSAGFPRGAADNLVGRGGGDQGQERGPLREEEGDSQEEEGARRGVACGRGGDEWPPEVLLK